MNSDLPAPADGRYRRIDVTWAHPVRRYDYWFGGKDNFAADQIAEAFPAIRTAVRETRRFLQRTVNYLAGPAGIRQFLEIGTGLPTSPTPHDLQIRALCRAGVGDPFGGGVVLGVRADGRKSGRVCTWSWPGGTACRARSAECSRWLKTIIWKRSVISLRIRRAKRSRLANRSAR